MDDPDRPADSLHRTLDLAVQDPRNHTRSAVKLARELGVEVGLITGRRDDTIRIRFRWPDAAPISPPMRLREVLGQMRGVGK